MTKAFLTLAPISQLPVIQIRKRQILVKRISGFRQTRPGHYWGIADSKPFHIEGGRAAGGTQREWFLTWDVIGGTIDCNSLVDCIKQIENA